MIYLLFSYQPGYNGSDSLHFEAACEDMITVHSWCHKENKNLVEEQECRTGSRCVFITKTQLLRPVIIRQKEDKKPEFSGKALSLTDSLPFGKRKGKNIKDTINSDLDYMRYLIKVCNLKVNEEVMKYFRDAAYKKAVFTPHIFDLEYPSKNSGGWASCNELEADAWGGCCPNM